MPNLSTTVEAACGREAAYALGGREVPLDSPEAVARRTIDPDSGLTHYQLKRDERGQLFNPHDPFFEPAHATAKNRWLGRDKYVWKKATAVAFELYLEFLRSGNPRHLRQAEREVV